MMLVLGLRLVLRGGREALTRLVLIAASVAVGVAVLLTVLADFHAFDATNTRRCWQCTEGTPVAGRPASPDAELWNYRQDYFRGRVIERLDVAPYGSAAPVIPGLSVMPAPGQYYASPALAALLAAAPPDELADRFPVVSADGRPAAPTGLIGPAALAGPTDLVIVIGNRPETLAALPGTARVTAIATRARPSSVTELYRFGFAMAAVALVFPLLTLIGTATRLAAARREERFAAFRLVGGTPRQVAAIASVDAVVGAVLGTAGGIAVFSLVRPAVARVAITGAPYFSSLVRPTPLEYALVVVGVPVLAAWAALWSLRRVRLSPLEAARRTTPTPPRAWRVLPLAVGIVSFAVAPLMAKGSTTPVASSAQAGVRVVSSPGGAALPVGLLGFTLVMVGLVTGGSWLTMCAARLAAGTARGAAGLLCARRLADDPKAAFRSVGGLVLAVFVGTVVAGVVPAVDAGMRTAGAGTLTDVLRATFADSGSGVGPDTDPSAGPGTPGPGTPGPGTAGPIARPAPETTGLAPDVAADLRHRLAAFPGAVVLPVYAPAEGTDSSCQAPYECAPISGVIACADLAPFPVFGVCPPGVPAVRPTFGNLLSHDDPTSVPMPIVDSQSPAEVAADVSALRLEAVLVREPDPAALERVRTLLSPYTALTGSATASKTFGEGAALRAAAYDEVQRVTLAVVAVTLVVAGCSLTVAVGGGLVERRRPFTVLRLGGTSVRTLYRVVLYESALPLLIAALVAAAAGLGVAASLTGTLIPGAPPNVFWPAAGYYSTLGAGFLASLLVIATALPLLRRLTEPDAARFE